MQVKNGGRIRESLHNATVIVSVSDTVISRGPLLRFAVLELKDYDTAIPTLWFARWLVFPVTVCFSFWSKIGTIAFRFEFRSRLLVIFLQVVCPYQKVVRVQVAELDTRGREIEDERLDRGDRGIFRHRS